MLKRNLYVNGFYHVYNRGVDKRDVYHDDADRKKFLRALLISNVNRDSGEPLVRIHTYCLLGNHFHLLLEQLAENGIPKFMQKIGTGYTMYFNKKYKRTGSLFESVYRSKEILSSPQLVHITRYIHLNPLDVVVPGWKTDGIHDLDATASFLENYPWSSYSAYLGKRDQLVDPSFVMEEFTSSTDYRSFVLEWTLPYTRRNLGEVSP